MISRVIAFASAKGGSGKSVTCLSYGRVIAALGLKVAVVDLDIETTGMTLIHLDQVLAVKRADNNVFQGLFDPPVEDATALLKVPLRDGLTLIPAQVELRPHAGLDNDGQRVKHAITYLRGQFDVVLLDLQAGLDPIAVAAAEAADDVVLVSEFDPVSIQGIKRLERLNPKSFSVESTWILYNKVLPELAERMADILRVERKLPALPWTVEVVRSYLEGNVPVDMSSPNPFTLTIVDGVQAILGGDVAGLVERWRAEAESVRRAPVVSRIAEIEQELDDLESTRIRIRTETSRREDAVRRGMLGSTAAVGLGAAALSLSSNSSLPSWIWVSLGVLSATIGLLVAGTELRWGLAALLRPYSRLFRLFGLSMNIEWLEDRFEQTGVDLRRVERQIEGLEAERLELSVAARETFTK